MRVAVKPLREYPWYLWPFFWNQKRKYGSTLDAALMWARSPKLFLGVVGLYGMVDRKSSLIEPQLRSLITVRISQINWCPFCVDLNSATLQRRGASMDKIIAVENWRNSNLFSQREQVALDYAESVTRSDVQVKDEQIQELRNHFENDAVVELTGLIAFQNMSSKFNAALAIEPQGFCKLPIVEITQSKRVSKK